MKICTALSLVSALVLLAACAASQPGPANSASAEAAQPDTLNVADAAIAGGDPNMALSVSQSVLATDAGNVDALEHEGDAYYALGRCPAAMAAYQLALTHDPKASAAETGLGRCLLKADPAAAETALEAAVADDPGNAAALDDLGVARDLQGNFAGAVDPYQKALIADPGDTAAEVNLGLSLALSGNATEGLQYLGPLATSPGATPKIRQDYALALVASGRQDEARQVLSVDLAPAQIDPAINGFIALTEQNQPATPPPPPPPAPTNPTVGTAPVTAAPILPSAAPVPLSPSASAAPVSPLLATVPNNSTAAYTGPAPAGVTASSSTPGPVAAAAPAAAPAAPFGHSVQLGALSSPQNAERAWRMISGAAPALFAGRAPEIEPVPVDGKTLYRLRVSGFPTTKDAKTFCESVAASGNPCTVVKF